MGWAAGLVVGLGVGLRWVCIFVPGGGPSPAADCTPEVCRPRPHRPCLPLLTGKSLKTLMSKGILQVHPPICDCPGCRISSPVVRWGRKWGYGVFFLSGGACADFVGSRILTSLRQCAGGSPPGK